LAIKQALKRIGDGELANPFLFGLSGLARDIENLYGYYLSSKA
jgi:hypothetical protein